MPGVRTRNPSSSSSSDETEREDHLQDSLADGKLDSEEDFQKMWAAHPHNYMDDSSQNTSSAELNKELGFKEDEFENTCAVRMSTMFNRLGGDFKISRQKAKEAGLDKLREKGLYMPRADDPKTPEDADYLILSAREMWTYMQHHEGNPSKTFPGRGRNVKREDGEKSAQEAKTYASGKKGFVAFDKLRLKVKQGDKWVWQGYRGTGHVDLFDGTKLSDGSWYAAQRIMLWDVVG